MENKSWFGGVCRLPAKKQKRANELEKIEWTFICTGLFFQRAGPDVPEENFSQEHFFKANKRSPLEHSLTQEQYDSLLTPIPRRVCM